MASTEGKFQVVGRNLITLANLLLGNQNICKLLYYTSKTPLSEDTIADPDFLMNKNIRMVPKVPDEKTEKGSFIIILLDAYDIDSTNEDIKLLTLRLDVICPIDEWTINEESLRPFLIMSEIDTMLNGYQIRGIGKLRFLKAERIVMSDIYAGYSLLYSNYEFS